MKNLFIYINPTKQFTNSDWQDETDVLVKVQIENSVALGWDRKDIVLVTNFDYEYDGVKAIVIGDENYCAHSSGTPSKINAICTMFEKGLIEDDLYFFHDFDAFQLEPITREELGMKEGQIALTDYGYRRGTNQILPRWSTGVIFFDNKTEDIFKWIKGSVYKYMANEEVSLQVMTRHNDHNLLERIKKLNITYNVATRRRNIEMTINSADKPLRVLHFHPTDTRATSLGGSNMEVCRQFLPQRLLDIFAKHNIV